MFILAKKGNILTAEYNFNRILVSEISEITTVMFTVYAVVHLGTCI